MIKKEIINLIFVHLTRAFIHITELRKSQIAQKQFFGL